MANPSKLLLQTTIPRTDNDWHIGRFSLLRDYLWRLTGGDGDPLFDIVARDRDPVGEPDSVLSQLDRSDFDELWLFAVDVGDGLTAEDCAAITRFRNRGGGLLVTRDHMDLGCSVCTLGGVGAAHHFHTKNPEPDERPRRVDDTYTTNISWPNYHSGATVTTRRLRLSARYIRYCGIQAMLKALCAFFPLIPMRARWGSPREMTLRESLPPAAAK